MPARVMIDRWIADHLVTLLRPSPTSTVDLGGLAHLSDTAFDERDALNDNGLGGHDRRWRFAPARQLDGAIDARFQRLVRIGYI
jgi:hypothetical protein